MSDDTLLGVMDESGPVRWYKARRSGRLVSLCARHAALGTRPSLYVLASAEDIPRFFRDRHDGCFVCPGGSP